MNKVLVGFNRICNIGHFLEEAKNGVENVVKKEDSENELKHINKA